MLPYAPHWRLFGHCSFNKLSGLYCHRSHLDRTKQSHNFCKRTEVTTSITLIPTNGPRGTLCEYVDLALQLSGSPFTVGVVEKEPLTNPQETPNTDLGLPLISVHVPKSGGPSAYLASFISLLNLILQLYPTLASL